MFRTLKRTFFPIIFSLFVVFSASLTASAQTIPGIAEPVTFSVVPDYPKPNEIVFISTQSFSTDLNKAIFKWTVNGKIYAEGAGMKNINIKTGKAGSLTTVSVEVSTADFGVIKNDITFRPAEVTLLWQADTYVPAFYKGKALHSFNGAFKVTAIPEFFNASGKRINPKNLIYTWKKNGNVDGDASGFGKDSFITSQTSYLRDGEDVSVEVSSSKDNLAGSASISVAPSVPEINLYENSPLYGIIYEHALTDNLNLSSEEITLRAEPFFTSVENPVGGTLNFDWTLNGASVDAFQNKNEITLRKAGSTRGRSDIGLIIQNRSKVLQSASASITIIQ